MYDIYVVAVDTPDQYEQFETRHRRSVVGITRISAQSTSALATVGLLLT